MSRSLYPFVARSCGIMLLVLAISIGVERLVVASSTLAATPTHQGPFTTGLLIPTITSLSTPTGTVSGPQSATDLAVVSGSLPLTGTVIFHLCGPSPLPTLADPATGCLSGGGTSLNSSTTLDANGAGISWTASASAPGLYCWRVDYSGDENYQAASATNNTTECFTIKLIPTITSLSTPTGTVSGPQSATDLAVVSGSLPLTGTVIFHLCGPSPLPTLADPATGCLSGGGTSLNSSTTLDANGAGISWTASASAPGLYCWRVDYSGDENYQAASATNNTTECFTVVASADLALAMTSTSRGGRATFIFSVTNGGPSTANSVTLSDVWTTSLSGGVQFVSATTTQGTCAFNGTATVTCNLGTLSLGATATIAITLDPKGKGTLTSTGSVASAVVDPNTSNNTATNALTFGGKK